jgi:hypothetical protein
MDRDTERGEFTGVVEVGPREVLLGSRSEGVLRLSLGVTP